MEEYFYGREVLISEIPKEKQVQYKEEYLSSGFITEKGMLYCRRCHAKVFYRTPAYCLCGGKCGYCTNCIQMGKVKSCSLLYHLPEPNLFNHLSGHLLKWEGELSIQQQEAAEEIVQSIKHNRTHLLWAVAGAGKTEMLFPGIERALLDRKRICLASPRVDVCLELAPRIQQAFPSIDCAILYGEMKEEYRYSQLVICTTHQLYRFKEAFDVLIIDEIDAFPFHNDLSLHFVASKARKRKSTLLYLTATPDTALQKMVKKKEIFTSILPARYHGYPLPVPKGKRVKNWKKLLLHSNSSVVIKHMKRLLKEKKTFLVFIPNIEWMKAFEEKLREKLPEAFFECVYAGDPLRKEKVKRMRENKLDFLISTTILERGVTFPNIDVCIIGAEDQIFTESSLVQMAGRVGRSPYYPTGEVTYYYDEWTKEMKQSIKQIKKMNKIANERGLLHG